jgi:hypothetical protein
MNSKTVKENSKSNTLGTASNFKFINRFDVHVTVHLRHCEGKEPTAYFVASSWFFTFAVSTEVLYGEQYHADISKDNFPPGHVFSHCVHTRSKDLHVRVRDGYCLRAL